MNRDFSKDKDINIAILDTGVDLDNPAIIVHARNIKCLPSKDSCKDTDGHGTSVALLILRFAPFVKLYIAKISSTRFAIDANTGAIAKVSL